MESDRRIKEENWSRRELYTGISKFFHPFFTTKRYSIFIKNDRNNTLCEERVYFYEKHVDKRSILFGSGCHAGRMRTEHG